MLFLISRREAVSLSQLRLPYHNLLDRKDIFAVGRKVSGNQCYLVSANP
jgi:hypothetical protein